MSLITSIVRQFVVSTVLLSVLQQSSGVRFTRSMRYPAPSMRKYMLPWKYIPYTSLPRSMQRRFMWKEMDDTVDELMGGVANGARAMTHMFNPSMVRYRKPIEYEAQPSSNVKYVIKKPPPPPFKRMKAIKLRAPKKTIPIYNVPIIDTPSVPHFQPPKPSIIMPFMSEDELRKIEKEQEKRVESLDHRDIHEHSHQTHHDNDVISGRINEFGQGWLPIKTPYSTPKPFAVSELHTHIESATTGPFLPTTQKDTRSYEVTEHSAEASVQKEQSFKPSKHFQLLGPTTEVPNYPEYFLKNIQTTEEPFKPRRVHLPITTSFATVNPIDSTTLSHRLPPRSTTERPFKRYNLHRPKSSKLFFSRPTSSPEPTRQLQTATTTERTINVVSEVLPLTLEPVKTTHDTIRTTREPLRTTRAPTKPPPEKVRTTRNNSEVRSKIRIKNTSQNERSSSQIESSNKSINKDRGTVKFGEKQR